MKTPKIDEKPKKIKFKFLPVTHEEVSEIVVRFSDKDFGDDAWFEGKGFDQDRKIRPFHFAIGAWDEKGNLSGFATVARVGFRDDAEVADIFNLMGIERRICNPSLEKQLETRCQKIWSAITGGKGVLLSIYIKDKLNATTQIARAEFSYIDHQYSKSDKTE